MTITYLLGDTRDMVATIPDGSVSLVACSPPFIALRSYLPADHPMKHAEIGSEPDPATFLDTLLALTAEWGRVLAPWGSIAIELGDTYSGVGGTSTAPNPAYSPERHAERATGDLLAAGNGWRKAADLANWPRPKCLALVPQLYAASLAYGRNLLTGEPSPAGQWLVRNMIVWHRPNPAVGALGDKFRPSTSYITVATRSPKRWFDLTAVRTEHTGQTYRMVGASGARHPDAPSERGEVRPAANPAGAPPLDAWFDEHDTWTMTTQPSSLAHYAMWPAKLAERLVLSMCPQWVCATCGEAKRRNEGRRDGYEEARRLLRSQAKREDVPATHAGLRTRAGVGSDISNGKIDASPVTLGWTDCGHDNYRPGVVLDPFGGTGTTNAVAELHGRDSIWVDIDERNRALVPQRMAEVSRSLFGTKAELPGQGDLFGGAA
jgi:hypothetical protein